MCIRDRFLAHICSDELPPLTGLGLEGDLPFVAKVSFCLLEKIILERVA